jgi:hypothetical protein
MRNPWTKKNPLMSMWLSAANRAVASARGQLSAAGKRQVAAAQAEAARQVVDPWTGKTARKSSRKKARR